MDIYVDQYLRMSIDLLSQLPETLFNILLDAFTYNNPEYDDGLSSGSTPEELRIDGIEPYLCTYFVDTETNECCFPRGGVRMLRKLLINEDLKLVPRLNQVEPILFTKKDTIQYRLYQQKSLTEVSHIAPMMFFNGILVAPAGSGKTVIGAGIIETLKLPTLIVVTSLDILDQWYDTLSNMFITNVEIGKVHGDHNNPEHIKPITITTINSLTILMEKKPEALVDKFGIILMDEAHHAPAPTFTKAGTFFKARYFFGLTATPFRKDKKDFLIFDYCGEIFRTVKDDELEREDVSVYPEVEWVITPFFVGEGYYPLMLRSLIRDAARNELIAQHIIKDSNEGHSILIISTRKEHCIKIRDLLINAGLDPLYVHGTTKKTERKQIMEKMRTKEADILIATNLADEGLDIDVLSCLHLVTPTKNPRLIIQRAGRIRRKCDDKLPAKIVDYSDDRVNIFSRSAESRMIMYKQNGFTIYKPK